MAGGWEVAGAFRRVERWEGYEPSLAASHPLGKPKMDHGNQISADSRLPKQHSKYSSSPVPATRSNASRRIRSVVPRYNYIVVPVVLHVDLIDLGRPFISATVLVGV